MNPCAVRSAGLESWKPEDGDVLGSTSSSAASRTAAAKRT